MCTVFHSEFLSLHFFSFLLSAPSPKFPIAKILLRLALAGGSEALPVMIMSLLVSLQYDQVVAFSSRGLQWIRLCTHRTLAIPEFGTVVALLL